MLEKLMKITGLSLGRLDEKTPQQVARLLAGYSHLNDDRMQLVQTIGQYLEWRGQKVRYYERLSQSLTIDILVNDSIAVILNDDYVASRAFMRAEIFLNHESIKGIVLAHVRTWHEEEKRIYQRGESRIVPFKVMKKAA